MSYFLSNTACLCDMERLIFIIGEKQVVFYPGGKWQVWNVPFRALQRVPCMLANYYCQTESGAQYFNSGC